MREYIIIIIIIDLDLSNLVCLNTAGDPRHTVDLVRLVIDLLASTRWDPGLLALIAREEFIYIFF